VLVRLTPNVKSRPYTKKLRAQSEVESRRRILDAAVACFSDRPLDRVTLEEVAKQSGLSVQTLLRVHGSKEDLFVSAARAIAGEAMRARDDVQLRSREEALEVLVDAYERWGEASERMAEQARRVEGIDLLLGELRSHHRRWIRRLFAGELSTVPETRRAQALALLVVALDLGTYRRLRAEGLSRAAATQGMKALTSAALLARHRSRGG
jgi:AcrR family transcriptional regulator